MIAKTVAIVAWAASGLLLYATLYGLVASLFQGRAFWDLERSLGGFTIHLTKNTSMDILWFQIIPFGVYLVLWAMLLVWILSKMEKNMPNTASHGTALPRRP
jgi:hypothetical protein